MAILMARPAGLRLGYDKFNVIIIHREAAGDNHLARQIYLPDEAHRLFSTSARPVVLHPHPARLHRCAMLCFALVIPCEHL